MNCCLVYANVTSMHIVIISILIHLTWLDVTLRLYTRASLPARAIGMESSIS